jgi:signal transduction histidine kinase/ligand-binding sensor domain-containing protein
MEKTLHICLLLIGLTYFGFLQAQNIGLEEYHQEDGLPTDLIKAFEVDSLGYIWIATDGGVVKFEGKEFIPIENIEHSSNYYKNLLFTHKFGFIAASDDGLISITKRWGRYFGEFTRNILEFSDWTQLQYSKSLFEAADSTLWIANNSGLSHLSEHKIESYKLPSRCHTNHYVRNHQFFEIDNKVYAICQNGELYFFDELTNQLVQINWEFEGTEVYSVLKLNENEVLVGINDGLVKLTFSANGASCNAVQLNFNYGVSIMVLHGQTIYLGTWSQGLFKAVLSANQLTYEHIKESGQKTINDILIDKQQQIWLATNFGVVLLRNLDFRPIFSEYSRNYIQDLEVYGTDIMVTDGWQIGEVDVCNQTFKRVFSQRDFLILQIIKRENQIWAATDEGKIIVIQDGEIIDTYDFSDKGLALYNLIEDKQKNLWFLQNRENIQIIRLSADGVEHSYDLTFDEGNFITMIEMSKQGDIYLGARGNESYLWKYNGTTDTFENISKPIVGMLKSMLEINDMDITRSGKIILASSEGVWEYSNQGLNRIDVGEMNVESVSSLALDKKERIWFINSSGLILYDNKKCLIFNNYDGIPSKTNSPRNLLVDDYNNLWMGSNLGMVVGKVKLNYAETPRPQLRYVESGFRAYDASKESRFLENSQLDLYFTTPIYPAKYISYEYCLQANGSEEWKPVRKNTSQLVFQHLEPGNYNFKLRAKGKGFYTWSKNLEYTFSVYQKWYTNAWILGFLYFGIVIGTFVYIRYARHSNEKEKRKLEEIIDQRTSDLQEQNEELTALNMNLQKAKETAEDAIKSKDRFFSILAHDLKSPFNTLIGFSELLVHNREEISEEEMQKFLEEMLHTSENTYKLLQNLLDWARSQTGALQIEKQNFNLLTLVQEVLTTVNATAKQKNVSIKIEIPDNLQLFADVSLIATVIRNLILNAIKFSYPQNNIKIKANAIDDHWAEIMVVDNGVGIDEEKITDLFSIDKNISTMGTAKEKGTGLGLILCKEFVEKCGGTISVESKKEIGSTFFLKLPRINLD